MNIKFLDFQAQYSSIKKEIDTAVSRVVSSQWFILGEELTAFEKEFADYLGVKYVVGVASGSDALSLSLQALGIGKGDEVITPVNSFIATALSITYAGATPVFVDNDKDTYQIDVAQMQKKITKKTKVIMPVHLYGAPSNIEEIRKIAKREKLFLVEDAAQAHGAKFNNKRVGTFGDLAAFSFYPGKNLGAYGDGGAISTNNETLYKKLIKLRNYGQKEKYYHDILGTNSRLDEIQAAVLRIKLKYLDTWNDARRARAVLYNELLKDFKIQKHYPGAESIYHVFVMEHAQRDKLQTYLKQHGINTLIHYPLPIYLQKCYEYLGFKKGDFPNADKSAKQILSLPMFPELTEKEINYIVKTIKSF